MTLSIKDIEAREADMKRAARTLLDLARHDTSELLSALGAPSAVTDRTNEPTLAMALDILFATSTEDRSPKAAAGAIAHAMSYMVARYALAGAKPLDWPKMLDALKEAAARQAAHMGALEMIFGSPRAAKKS